MKIVIAGATGFIGHSLIESLLSQSNLQIVGLSRSELKSSKQRLEYRKADLFSLLEVEKAVEGCEVAVYLVHSMMKSSRLTQGDFADLDYILADNFRRACEKASIKKIIYVGGIVPEKDSLSDHLRSRKEVEEVLGSGKAALVTMRCGLVVGPGGSSFEILYKLVSRLPAMVIPHWCQNSMQPVFLYDLIEVIVQHIVSDQQKSEILEVAGPEKVTYFDLIQRTARVLDQKRWFFPVPFVSIGLSKLWVKLVTGSHKALVYPLIESLRHEMIVTNAKGIKPVICATTVDQALRKTFEADKRGAAKALFKKVKNARALAKRNSEVRSVQRLQLPRGITAEQAAQLYFRWLPAFFWSFLRAEITNDVCVFRFSFFRRPLLKLEYSSDRSQTDRQLFYANSGLLVSPLSKRGRLEFREGVSGDFLLTAIHQFVPSLPWFIYKYSQALMHVFVMNSFGRFLAKQVPEEKEFSK